MILNEAQVRKVSLSFMDNFFPAKDYTWIRSDKEHYRLLTYITKQYNGITILDLGTDTGASCLSLAQNPNNRVITYDIKPKNLNFGYSNITVKTMDVLTEDYNILKSAHIILLDIDPHDGIQEARFFEILEQIGYKGIVICDDFYNMGHWWPNIKQPKYDVSYMGHFTGTLVVNFSDENVEIINNKPLRKMNLRDNTFAHHTRVGLPDISVAGQMSECVEWDRSCSNVDLPTFYTHECMSSANTPLDISYGFLFESQSIIPDIYKGIESLIPKFKLVFTHSSDFLRKYENCRWIPGGGIWIGGSYGMGEIDIKNKNRICSFVSSDKTMCEMHNLRLDMYNSINSSLLTKFGRPWVRINTTLENFMFSVVVENYIDDMYFTEKILNCFATGTIPIYWGARNIEQKFNGDGIIKISSKNDLLNVMGSLNQNLYNSKIHAVRDNFVRCQEYRVIEDFIANNYL